MANPLPATTAGVAGAATVSATVARVLVMLHFTVLHCFVNSTEENRVYVTTRPVNDTTPPLEIVLVLTGGSPIITNQTFEFRDNPVFINIIPTNHLTA